MPLLIDGRATGTCRSINASTIDAAVVHRPLTALTPAEIELAFTAADRVADDRGRVTKAADSRSNGPATRPTAPDAPSPLRNRRTVW